MAGALRVRKAAVGCWWQQGLGLLRRAVILFLVWIERGLEALRLFVLGAGRCLAAELSFLFANEHRPLMHTPRAEQGMPSNHAACLIIHHKPASEAQVECAGCGVISSTLSSSSAEHAL